MTPSKRCLKSLLLPFCLLAFELFAKPAATVVGITGKVDWRIKEAAVWEAAKVQQVMEEGQHIKTGRRSKTALLFTDQSQMRLNQNSLLIVKSVLDERGEANRFRLNHGRAWVKSKNTPDKLIMETPSSVAAIRGTDWDIEVDERGVTRLTVVHGSVELSNAFGRVTINSGEQGIAEPGKAPVKIIVVNPAERIQWVTQYQSDLHRLLSEHPIKFADNHRFSQVMEAITENRLADAEQLLSNYPDGPEKLLVGSDILLYAGDIQNVIANIQRSPYLASTPALRIKLVRAQLAAGKPDDLSGLPESAEAHITKGDISIFTGSWKNAVYHYQKALELNPNNPFAYYGLGKVYSEREYVDFALEYLTKAIALQNNPRFLGEQATTYTFANELDDAQSSFEQAFAVDQANAILLTGRGILHLKQGEPEQAIQDFLRASTLEPRFARANVFLAIAYYQLGKHVLALETLSYASELDDKDPMPYLLRSTIESEKYEPYQALNASRNALLRLPNLKSLNQLAGNRSGNNNLGAAIANYGMNEWALSIALDSYDPFWSASHLFLADRITDDQFVSTSERFKGFLLDPTVFGASNRYPSLIKTPGHYYSISNLVWRSRSDAFTSTSQNPDFSMNGYFSSPFPIAYFAQFTDIKIDTDSNLGANDSSSDIGTSIEPNRRTYGLGTHLTDKLRFFYFDEEGDWDSEQKVEVLSEVSNANFDTSRLFTQGQKAVGITYQWSPNWLFMGLKTRFVVDTDYFDEFQLELDSDFFAQQLSSSGTGNNDTVQESQHVKVQFRNEQTIVGLGYETIEHSNLFDSFTDTSIRFDRKFNGEIISTTESFRQEVGDILKTLETEKYFVNVYHRFNDTLLGQVGYAHYKLNTFGRNRRGTPEEITYEDFESVSLSDNLFALGLNYKWRPNHTFKIGYSEFLHSMTESTLDENFVASIPHITRYLSGGGTQQTSSFRWEYNGFEDTYITLAAIRRHFENRQLGLFAIQALGSGLTDVKNLANRIEGAFTDDTQTTDFIVNNIPEGIVRTYQLGLNHYLSKYWAASLNQEWQDNEDISDLENRKPIQSDHDARTRLGLVYSSPDKYKVGLLADYYDFVDQFSLRKDGWYVRLTYIKEFYRRHVFLYSQLSVDDTLTDRTDALLVGVDIRF